MFDVLEVLGEGEGGGGERGRGGGGGVDVEARGVKDEESDVAGGEDGEAGVGVVWGAQPLVDLTT